MREKFISGIESSRFQLILDDIFPEKKNAQVHRPFFF